MDNWDKKKAVQRMQQYIAEHLGEPITLRMLADAAGYSPWHAERVFKEVTGETPFAYLRAARLARAAAKLRDTEAKIVDVAFDFVFDSHEGFTRAFSKHFGLTPQAFRKEQPLIKFFLPKELRDSHLTFQRGEQIMSENPSANTVFVQVIDRPARKLIMRRGKTATNYFEYTDEIGCEEWDVMWEQVLSKITEALYEPAGYWLPEKFRRPGTSVYVPGVEVAASFAAAAPEGFEIIDLPACQMMVFQGPPYEDANENYMGAIDGVQAVIARYDPKLYGFEWAPEDGPRFQFGPMGYRGYIEALPVRALNVKAMLRDK